jgi:hypothetical protein
MDKPEEGTVFPWEDRGHELKLDLDFISNLHWAWNWIRLGFKVISISLNEEGIEGPLLFSIVSEGPCLSELFSGLDLVSVTEVLLDKSCLVDHLLLMSSA